MKKAAKLEKQLYPSLEQWLRTHRACSQTWHMGQKPVIRLKVPGPNRRTPDLAGALLAQGTWRTHIIEAKKSKSGAALQTAVAQLESAPRSGPTTSGSPWTGMIGLDMDPQAQQDYQPVEEAPPGPCGSRGRRGRRDHLCLSEMRLPTISAP